MTWKTVNEEIIFIGIPESIGPDSLINSLVVDLPTTLNLHLSPNPLIVERAHRLRVQRDQRGGRPRPAIARFHNWSIKERILRVYRQQPELHIGDHNILLFQNYSTQVALKKKTFSPVCHHLHEQNAGFNSSTWRN